MMETLTVKAGNVTIGGETPVVVQTMCNTHTSDVDGTRSTRNSTVFETFSFAMVMQIKE